MGRQYDFDYIVIGSGPAGSVAALTLAKGKKRVGLVEKRFFGGSNLNTSDVPYGAALDFSHTFCKALTFPELKNQDFYYNMPTIPARELKTVIEAGGNNKKIFEDAGVTCIKGLASFLDNHTIAVGEKKYTAGYFVIATGAHLKVSGIAGVEAVDYLSPEDAIKVRRLPRAVAVVGGGATGCEVATYFAELGAKVLIFETSDRILPREDKEVGDVLAEYLSQKLGVSVLPKSKVVAIEQDNLSKRVVFRYESAEKLVRVDCIVLATGSEPNLDCGLENAKIKYSNTGIKVDKLFNTSAKNIFAVGDCIGGDSSTEKAYQEGISLANNLTKKTKNILNYKGFARLVNTMPEIATVGLNEDDLMRRDRKYKKAFVKLSEVTASKIYNLEYGFVKLLADKNNKILGATIMAPGAGLMIGELAIAVRHGLTALELASTPHVMNNFSYAIKIAAKQLVTKKH